MIVIVIFTLANHLIHWASAEGWSSQIASISVAMSCGKIMPTADRAPTPASGPKTSLINSEYPLITCASCDNKKVLVHKHDGHTETDEATAIHTSGCWLNPCAELTMPSVFTNLFIWFNDPSCACNNGSWSKYKNTVPQRRQVPQL